MSDCSPLIYYRKVSHSIIQLVSKGVEVSVMGDIDIPPIVHNQPTDNVLNPDAMQLSDFHSHNTSTITNHQNKTLHLVLSTLYLQ